MESELICRDVERISRAEAQRRFEAGDLQDIADALLGLAYFDDDPEWVENVCLRYLENENNHLKAIAATCLGHLARIHGSVDSQLVIPKLEQITTVPEIGGIVDDAIDDIYHWETIRKSKTK